MLITSLNLITCAEANKLILLTHNKKGIQSWLQRHQEMENSPTSSG